jgi:hypothetical protein
MLGADVVGAKETQKRDVFMGPPQRFVTQCAGVGGGFNSGAAIGFFALHDANHRGDVHAGILSSLDGGNGGSSGGANIVDDDDTSAFSAEALDAAARSVSFLGFADKESMEQRRVGMRLRAPGARRGHVGHDRIGAHRQPTDCFGINLVCFKQLKNGVAGEATALGVQSGGAAVNVVVAGAAGGELELAQLEAGAGEEREELLGVGFVGHRNHFKLAALHILSKWRKPPVPINASEKMMKL